MAQDRNSTDKLKNRISYFERVLEIYGAASSRWPDEDREFLLKLVAEDHSAGRLYQEAVALERVLDNAPDIKETSELLEHIQELSARRENERHNFENDALVIIPEFSKRPITEFVKYASLLAAALVFGIYLGVSDIASSLYPFSSQDVAGGLNALSSLSDESTTSFGGSFL